jgi:hypothetical protein
MILSAKNRGMLTFSKVSLKEMTVIPTAQKGK